MRPEFIFNDGGINEKAKNLQYVSRINFVNSNQKSTMYFLFLCFDKRLYCLI